MRIVSLVPAGTDIVSALGLQRQLVGVSHECDASRDIPRLTRSIIEIAHLSSAQIDSVVSERAAAGVPMYELDVDRLSALRPDLVIAQSLCDVCALPATTVERALAELSPAPTVVTLGGDSIDGMLASIRDIGAAIDRTAEAALLVATLEERLARVAETIAGRAPVPVLCLEWLDPPYTCGHWIPEMVARAGGTDLLGHAGKRSVPVSLAQVEAVHPRLVIAMPCGYDLARALGEVEVAAARPEWRQHIGAAKIFAAAGGAYFTRPGPELVTGVEVLASVLHPDAAAWPVPSDAIAPWRQPAGAAQ